MVVAERLTRNEILRQVSPGFYFQRCLRIWEPSLTAIRKEGKADAVAGLDRHARVADVRIEGEPDLYRALLERGRRSFESLRSSAEGAELTLRNLSPFVTGIGAAHPLENGFSFLKPYGVPYLAGSGVKGAVRAGCRCVWQQEEDGRVGSGEAHRRLLHYFGSHDKDARPTESNPYHRGALFFFDLLPDVESWADVFRLDIVNPHYGPYYQGKDVPADWHAPVPSFFLTLRADLPWRLRIVYAPPDPGQRRSEWASEVLPGLHRVLTVEGFGAKKSWGYGPFTIEEVDPKGPPWSELVPRPRGSDRLETQPEVGARPGAVAPVQEGPTVSPGAASLKLRIDTIKDTAIGRELPSIAQALERCSPEDRPALVQSLHARLRHLGLSERGVRDWVKRFSIFRLSEEA